MTNNIPLISYAKQICIVCEGNEEYKYLDRLIELQVWNSIYKVHLDNAKGNGNIAARYHNSYQNDAYDAVFVFCDTEKKPHKQYEEIKEKINGVHGLNVAEHVIIFANPCTLQIVSKHWTDQIIKSPAKPKNAQLIENYTGVENYKGREDQIKTIMETITSDNYAEMKDRIQQMPTDDETCGSTNFLELIQKLETDDCSWIDKLNDKLNGS